jgi:dTDP-glucose pyrophosphorylase
MVTWRNLALNRQAPLVEALSKINSSARQIALVLNSDETLAGVITDGDIRRALLSGKSLETPVAEVMNLHPKSIEVTATRSEMLATMRRQSLHHLPLTDSEHRVVGLVTLDDLLKSQEYENWVVLMVGGLGSRLQPLTHQCPKPLLPVAGKPILEIIIENFIDQGFKKFFLSVNYKADMIQSHFKDGSQWNIEISYLHEHKRMGTAGALSLLPHKPQKPLIVMNGDILTKISFEKLLQFHQAQGAIATMAVREYDFQVPYGVVKTDGTQIQSIEEKPVHKFFVNAGIYALSPAALDYLPSESFFDMPTLFEKIISGGRAAVAYPLREYWLDIGRLDEFERAQQEWSQ